jgi:glycolate oxidase iron-sulfur subunit
MTLPETYPDGPIPKIDEELLSACIHCGMCLPACPTYNATGREMESPRGRIYLLTMLQKGETGPEDRLVEHIDSCLGCLGCQTACPSGVQYGKILDQARPLLAEKRDPKLRNLMRFAFSRLLPDYGRLRVLGKILRLWQKTGINSLLTKAPFASKLLSKLVDMQDFLPPVPVYKPLPRQSWQSGEKTGEVQLFAGCVMDVFYNDVNHACIRLLTLQRQIVKVPDQTCCGALAFHAGETDIARDLAKRNIEYFENIDGDIVVTSAGCGAMLKEYGELLHADHEWHDRAHKFSQRIKDITEFLADHEFSVPPHKIERSVAYHAACHLAHAQGIRQAPAKLLARIPGLELIPLEEAEHCCGSAGIYNLLHTEMSMEVLDRKMYNIKNTGADVLVTTNPGCLLQIQKGIRDANVPMRACHLVELLDESFGDGDES